MKLLSWNVAGRNRKLRQQFDRVVERKPDVVALQEVTAGTYVQWRQELMKEGYSVLANVDLVALAYPPPHTRFVSVPPSRW